MFQVTRMPLRRMLFSRMMLSIMPLRILTLGRMPLIRMSFSLKPFCLMSWRPFLLLVVVRIYNYNFCPRLKKLCRFIKETFFNLLSIARSSLFLFLHALIGATTFSRTTLRIMTLGVTIRKRWTE